MSCRLIPGSTTADTSELGTEVTGGTAVLLAVVVPVATGSAVGALTTGATDLGGTRGTDSLLVGGGDDLSGEVEPIASMIIRV
jgi:hypothetical protein